MKPSYQNHPVHTNRKFTPQFARKRPRPVGAEPALFIEAPARTLTAADAAEIRRAVAIWSMAPPEPGEMAALLRDLSEQFLLPVHVVIGLVAWHRLGNGGRA